MKAELKLDQRDLAIIYYLKQDITPSITGVKKIWVKYCDSKLEYIQTFNLVVHFAPILTKLFIIKGILDNESVQFLRDCSPQSTDMFQKYFKDEESARSVSLTNHYYNRIFAVICSRLRFIENGYLPGYLEYCREIRKGKID